MRYRPFGRSGNAVSAIALALDERALHGGRAGCKALVVEALEQGVNTFHLSGGDPILPEVVGEALATVDRSLVFVALCIGDRPTRGGRAERDFSPEGLTHAVDRALSVSGLGHIDLAMLDNPAGDEMPQASLTALKALRSAGRVRLLGIGGSGSVMESYVSTNAFDVLGIHFHVNSPWSVRNLIRSAVERDMAVVAREYFPESLDTPKKAEESVKPKRKGLFGFGKAPVNPLAGAGTFAFLHRTPGWTAEEACLAYVLTEPTLATVLVEAHDAERLAALARVPERDLPPGLTAQIEMARVGAANQQVA
ncbi:MAG TPA: aldo/keto reductase [Caulobacteraceae bacterium]